MITKTTEKWKKLFRSWLWKTMEYPETSFYAQEHSFSILFLLRGVLFFMWFLVRIVHFSCCFWLVTFTFHVFFWLVTFIFHVVFVRIVNFSCCFWSGMLLKCVNFLYFSFVKERSSIFKFDKKFIFLWCIWIFVYILWYFLSKNIQTRIG